MTRYFTHYWSNSTWDEQKALGLQGTIIPHLAGNLFKKRGVSIGDFIYVLSVINGELFVSAKLKVGFIGTAAEAANILQDSNLWEAEDHVIADQATIQNFDLMIPNEVTRKLFFIGATGSTSLVFKADNRLDQQTLRGLRELEPESAKVLDLLLPPLSMVQILAGQTSETSVTLAEEVTEPKVFFEGATKTITINAYERNLEGREACLKHYGYNCAVCDFNFEKTYGELGKNFVHVHHLRPLAEIKIEYKLDPIKDLRPVCPNCHAMLHRMAPAISIDSLKQRLRK